MPVPVSYLKDFSGIMAATSSLISVAVAFSLTLQMSFCSSTLSCCGHPYSSHTLAVRSKNQIYASLQEMKKSRPTAVELID